MVKLVGLLVCFLIVVIDVGAGILGIQAEAEQNKVHAIYEHGKHMVFNQKILEMYSFFNFYWLFFFLDNLAKGEAFKAVDI